MARSPQRKARSRRASSATPRTPRRSDMSSIELQPSVEQREAWERAAGDQSLSAWLATVADAASGTQPAMTWPHTVALRYPVEFGKETVTSLVFKRGRMEFL